MTRYEQFATFLKVFIGPLCVIRLGFLLWHPSVAMRLMESIGKALAGKLF